MALRHCDNFAIYSTGATGNANMLLGVWANISVQSGCGPSTANPNGTLGTHHYRFTNNGASTLRRVLGGSLAEVGYGAAYYLGDLPSSSTRVCIVQMRDGSNNPQFTVLVTSTGALQVRSGSESGTIVATSTSLLTAGSYYFIELVAHIGDAAGSPAGSIEIRVNGEEFVNATGVDTRGQSTTNVEQYVIGILGAGAWNAGSGNLDVADLFVWDRTGSRNNDFLGFVRVLTLTPNSDGATTDWVRNTGANDYETVDDSAQDGDTTYVEASSAGDTEHLGLSDLDASITQIFALQPVVMYRKTDAGAGSAQTALVSGVSTALGTDRALTQTYTYYVDVIEDDPATSNPWQPTAVNSVTLQLDRTA